MFEYVMFYLPFLTCKMIFFLTSTLYTILVIDVISYFDNGSMLYQCLDTSLKTICWLYIHREGDHGGVNCHVTKFKTHEMFHFAKYDANMETKRMTHRVTVNDNSSDGDLFISWGDDDQPFVSFVPVASNTRPLYVIIIVRGDDQSNTSLDLIWTYGDYILLLHNDVSIGMPSFIVNTQS